MTVALSRFFFFFFEWRKRIYPLNYDTHSLENGFEDSSKHTVMAFFIKYDRGVVNVDNMRLFHAIILKKFLNSFESLMVFTIKSIENDYP